MFVISQHDFYSRAAEREEFVWFVVRYSNGACKPETVEHWPISKLLAAVKHLGKWIDIENKNANATG